MQQAGTYVSISNMGAAIQTELLTTQQVADQFQVHRSTVLRWAKDGDLHRIKVGRTTRFRADEIRKILHESNVAS